MNNNQNTNTSNNSNMDISRNIVLKIPKIEIIGKNEVKIENYKGIIIFDKQKIKINTKIGILNILGDDFNLLFMGGQTLIIEGKFKSLEYEGDV